MDFSGIVALVLGDVMLDHYIAGHASRVSPEAPVPVVARRRSWTMPGGAANVARGLAALGCSARLVGLIGRDQAGDTLAREVAAAGIQGGLVVSGSRPTVCKTRIMAQGQQLLRLDEELVRPPSLEEKVALRLHFEKLLPGCHVIILSDYAKGVLLADRDGQSLCQFAIAAAADRGLPVLVDPKGLDWARYAGAQCVTPNTREFFQICETLGRVPGEASALAEDARPGLDMAGDICARFNLGRLLLTRGARGMLLFEPGRKPVRIRAARREVADVSGAGDTVIAALAACAAKGMSWPESAVTANAAAGVAVGKTGAATVSISELNAALRQGQDNPKLYDQPGLVEKLKDWRDQGQRIVFTNGCFDLLHPGHISLLRQSAALGDRLVIGLNSDQSVARLKGGTRPIQNGHSRALLLSAIQFVDAIIMFEEDTPENLIKLIRPDVLVKGSDYALEDVVGAAFVQGYGGQVHLVDLVEGCSTTGLVSRMGPDSICRS